MKNTHKIKTERVIRAICSDYPRRKILLEKGQMPDSILLACTLLNQAVDESIADAYRLTRAFSPNFGNAMRIDIAEGRGFAFSPLSAVMSEGSYKKYKRLIKDGIVKRLAL